MNSFYITTIIHYTSHGMGLGHICRQLRRVFRFRTVMKVPWKIVNLRTRIPPPIMPRKMLLDLQVFVVHYARYLKQYNHMISSAMETVNTHQPKIKYQTLT